VEEHNRFSLEHLLLTFSIFILLRSSPGGGRSIRNE
jgi:hypothetical protein